MRSCRRRRDPTTTPSTSWCAAHSLLAVRARTLALATRACPVRGSRCYRGSSAGSQAGLLTLQTRLAHCMAKGTYIYKLRHHSIQLSLPERRGHGQLLGIRVDIRELEHRSISTSISSRSGS